MDDPPKAEESAASATEAAATAALGTAEPRDDGLDDDSPGEVRVTFIVLMLAAALLCALPRQWMSAGILLGLAVVGLIVHLRARGRPRG